MTEAQICLGSDGMKLVISDTKTGITYQAEIPKERESSVIGLKIGETLEGGIVGADGYKLQITGGSDATGVPMRRDVSGGRRAQLLLSDRPGFRPKRKGERGRKTVRGNQVTADIAQLNTKAIEAGAKPLEELFPRKAKEKKEEKKG